MFPLYETEDEDINGVFPEAVYIKTRTQTFNLYHYYLIQDGLIWYKSIDGTGDQKEWALFKGTGLPHHSGKIGFSKTRRIVEISADADELVALSEEGGFYRFCFDRTIAHRSTIWLDRQGWPREDQLLLDERTAKNRAWALGKRNFHVLYYEDTFGNQHHNGTMEIATTYMLLEDGQEICYADTGIPSDFSRNYLGPERGTFRAVSLSASASTVFLINEAGEMYTRMADFDIVGCDPMLFKYTYIPYKSDLPGTNYFSNLNEWGLPAEDWRVQPRIYLAGNAALSRHITILQNGQGNGARELRVAGRNEDGDTGYWSKALFDETWSFVRAPLFLPEKALLSPAANGAGERGQSLDKSFTGYWWKGTEKETEMSYTIPNFNILEGDCDLQITWRDEVCILRIHPIELWTYLKRNYLPGRTGYPKLFFATLDMGENAFIGLSEEFTRRLRNAYGAHDKVPFQYTMAASSHYIFFRDRNKADRVLFLTDGTIPDSLPQFHRIWYTENYPELERYNSADLKLAQNTVFTYENYDEVLTKIGLNKKLQDDIKVRNRAAGMNKLFALGMSSGYLPLDGIIKVSPLRFIDVPKMRTMTKYGSNIVTINHSYVNMVSDVHIWVNEKIKRLLELRIRCYTEIAGLIEQGEAVSIPPWFSETITDYWDIAGLPRRISGTFYNPSLLAGEFPGILSFTLPPDKESEIFGWHITIGNEEGNLFIDPEKSLKTLFLRRDKTAHQRTIHLGCTLYIMPNDSSGAAKTIIENSLTPFKNMGSEGIGVIISFDGENFIIKENPPAHSNKILFRGKMAEYQ